MSQDKLTNKKFIVKPIKWSDPRIAKINQQTDIKRKSKRGGKKAE